MKTIKTATVTLASLISLSANAAVPGLYAGASVGLQDFLADYRITDVDEDNDVSKSRFKLANDGIMGNIFAGYQQSFFSNAFIAFQADYQFTNTHVQINSNDVDGDTGEESITSQFSKIKNSFGLSVRPGLFINSNYQGYGVIGYRKARFESGLIDSDDDVGSIHFQKKFNENGIEYGVGGQVQVNQKLAVRLELTQTQYKNKPFALPVSDTTLNHKYKVNQGLLSILYHPAVLNK